MKLKTLNDMIYENGNEAIDEEIIFGEALKKEAVKWVKKMLKDKVFAEGAAMMTKFFNLTEEDLK